MAMLTMAQEGRIDFSSRISARAVAFGATVALAVLSVLMALGGGLGLIPTGSMLDAHVLRDAGAGLMIWTALSWIAAAFAGAFVAGLSARTALARDGLLHGVATWAVACLSAGILSGVWFVAALSLDMVSRDAAGVFASQTALWSYFLADVLALGAALAGGFLGTRSEARLPHRLRLQREERARTMVSQSAAQSM